MFFLKKFGVVSVLLAILTESVYAKPVPLAKFEPPAGKVLAIIGQNQIDIDAYIATVVGANNKDLMPGGVTLYAKMNNPNGFKADFDMYDSAGTELWDGVERLQCVIDSQKYPNSVMHLSISIENVTQKIADGTYDNAIDGLGVMISNLNRPVFLRIGYEYDNPGHGIERQYFAKAWQRIVDRLRANGVNNFATVFASSFQVRIPLIGGTYADYYPGDNYVDWVGFSYWGGPLANRENGMLDFARTHQKPVMIAESAPLTARIGDRPLVDYLSWFAFYNRYFNLISSANIKAFHYINADWARDNKTWESSIVYRPFVDMDSRVEESNFLKYRWRQEMKNTKYLHATNHLFADLGYVKKASANPISNSPYCK